MILSWAWVDAALIRSLNIPLQTAFTACLHVFWCQLEIKRMCLCQVSWPARAVSGGPVFPADVWQWAGGVSAAAGAGETHASTHDDRCVSFRRYNAGVCLTSAPGSEDGVGNRRAVDEASALKIAALLPYRSAAVLVKEHMHYIWMYRMELL